MNLYNPDDLPQNRIGMTVREEIASRVLAGILYSDFYCNAKYPKMVAEIAVEYADALIEELERTKK